MARFVAINAPVTAEPDGDAVQVIQRFQFVEWLAGHLGRDDLPVLEYRCTTRDSEHVIQRGTCVLWIAEPHEGARWRGLKALPDTPQDRAAALQAAPQGWKSECQDHVCLEVQTPKNIFALGESMPFKVWLQNEGGSDGNETLDVWSDLAGRRFQVSACDGAPVAVRKELESIADRASPLIVRAQDGPSISVDLKDGYTWLPHGGVRHFNLVWQGAIRVARAGGEPHTLECATLADEITVRDPASLAWGPQANGLACGIAAESLSVAQGERLVVHFGLRFDAAGADSSVERLNPEERSRRFVFTLTDTRTGKSVTRPEDTGHFGSVPMWIPKPDDFIRLRANPVQMYSVPVRLLSPQGEQLPEGDYSVEVTYENDGWERSNVIDSPKPLQYPLPSQFWKGKVRSGSIRLHVRHAEAEEVELWTNSTLGVQVQETCAHPMESLTKPTIVRLVNRPGYILGKKHRLFEASGNGEFTKILETLLGGSVWNSRGSAACIPYVLEHAAAGDSVRLRADMTITERSDPYSPFRGDLKVLWTGSIYGRYP